MMLTIFKFELKKLFCTKVNVIALAGSVIMLLLLVISSISEEAQVSREAAKELSGRAIDGQLLAATDQDIDLTQVQAADLYELRDKEIAQRMERQGLSDKEKEYWYRLETEVQKPFVFGAYRGPAGLLRSFQALGFFMLLLSAIGLSGTYARESADSMNQLLLCSRYGKRELYAIKLAAGFTWILTAALLVLLSVAIPYFGLYGTEGTAEMLTHGISPDRSVRGVSGTLETDTKDMVSQTECRPDEFRLFQLQAAQSGGKAVYELSGGPRLIHRNRHSGIADRKVEI